MSGSGLLLDAALIGSTLRFATPILLAALGGLLCQRAGVLNVALEGLLLAGAFAAVAGSYYGGSGLAGALLAMAAGAALGGIFALFAVRLHGHPIVVGLALNLLVAGLTVYLLRVLFGQRGAFRDPSIAGLSTVELPGVELVPLLGPLLSGHSWPVYLSWLLVLVLHLLLYRHPLGLRLRGVGENAEAAAALGVSPRRVRCGVLALSGVLCGLGGAQLALGNVTLFVENMSAGRGWIAVVAVMLGRSHPVGVAGASLLFGFTDALSFRLQGAGLASQFTEAFPYLVTLLALFLFEARSSRGTETGTDRGD